MLGDQLASIISCNNFVIITRLNNFAVAHCRRAGVDIIKVFFIILVKFAQCVLLEYCKTFLSCNSSLHVLVQSCISVSLSVAC